LPLSTIVLAALPYEQRGVTAYQLSREAARGGFDQLAIESVKWCHAPAEAGDRIPRRRVGGF
jgi:hypothetical protein